jgi:hypothetical protein
VITQIDPADPTAIDISPPLGFTPSAGMILDLGPYPGSADPTVDLLMKKLYAFLSPTVAVTGTGTLTSFPVASPSEFTVGNYVTVRNSDFSVQSPRVPVTSVIGSTVTVATTLGFIPDATFFVDGIGFKDGTGSYLYD